MHEKESAQNIEDFDRVVALRDAIVFLKEVGKNLIKY